MGITHICKECKSSFPTFQQLQEHKQQKHQSAETLSSKTRIILGAIVLIIIAGIVLIPMLKSGPYDDFAQCVEDSGAKMYGAFWCPHCNEQKALFADSASKLPYVECSTTDRKQKTVCTEAGIQTYPTWIFANGERVEGVLSLQTLASKTGCSVS